MENDNKRLFEWLNPGACWHEKASTMGPTICKHCKEPWPNVCNLNPDYSTESGFFALLDGLRAKGLVLECDSIADVWDVRLYLHDRLALSIAKAHADTLPLALFNASIKAMEAEEAEMG